MIVAKNSSPEYAVLASQKTTEGEIRWARIFLDMHDWYSIH